MWSRSLRNAAVIPCMCSSQRLPTLANRADGVRPVLTEPQSRSRCDGPDVEIILYSGFLAGFSHKHFVTIFNVTMTQPACEPGLWEVPYERSFPRVNLQI